MLAFSVITIFKNANLHYIIWNSENAHTLVLHLSTFENSIISDSCGAWGTFAHLGPNFEQDTIKPLKVGADEGHFSGWLWKTPISNFVLIYSANNAR